MVGDVAPCSRPQPDCTTAWPSCTRVPLPRHDLNPTRLPSVACFLARSLSCPPRPITHLELALLLACQDLDVARDLLPGALLARLVKYVHRNQLVPAVPWGGDLTNHRETNGSTPKGSEG